MTTDYFRNQNYDLPIRFGTPACLIGDDRHIAAKIPQTPFLNSQVTEPIFTKFLHTVETLVPLLMRVFPER